MERAAGIRVEAAHRKIPAGDINYQIDSLNEHHIATRRSLTLHI